MSKSLEFGNTGVMNNIEATNNVVYLCAKHKKWLIFSSTQLVYDAIGEVNPNSLYSYSKLASESVIRGYGVDYGLDWTIQRIGNIYGPGMRKNMATYVFIDNCLKNKNIVLENGGETVIDLIYIDNLIDAITSVLDNPDKYKNKYIDLKNPYEYKMIDLAQKIKENTKSKSEIILLDKKVKKEDNNFMESIKIKTNLDLGLEETYNWTVKNKD